MEKNLRAPSIDLVKKWGKQLNLSNSEVDFVNSRLKIRHQLG